MVCSRSMMFVRGAREEGAKKWRGYYQNKVAGCDLQLGGYCGESALPNSLLYVSKLVTMGIDESIDSTAGLGGVMTCNIY